MTVEVSDLAELRERVAWLAAGQARPRLVAGVKVFSTTRVTAPLGNVAEPVVSLVAQGAKRTVLGERAPGMARDDYYIPYLKMLGSIAPGDVVVSQPNDSTVSHFGELSAETAKFRGGAGIVVDGGVRDIDYIVKLGFPAFARYTTPRDIVGRWRLLDVNVPVTIGRTRVQPGDYVLGDRDGVLIIPAQVADEVIGKAEEVIHTENHLRKAILEGMQPLEAYQKFGRF